MLDVPAIPRQLHVFPITQGYSRKDVLQAQRDEEGRNALRIIVNELRTASRRAPTYSYDHHGSHD